VITARYALSPNITKIRFVLEGKVTETPVQAWTDPYQEVGSPRISRQSAHVYGMAVSPTHRPPHFCRRLSRPRGRSAAGRIKSMKNPNDPIGNNTN
jgi:hypothetical protein